MYFGAFIGFNSLFDIRPKERFWVRIQGRKGPNVVGVYGVLQPLVDGLNCLLKK